MKNKSLYLIAILLFIISINIVLGVAPVTESSTILPVTAYTNDTLLGYCNITDIDEDIITYEYEWYKNDVLHINGAKNISSTCYQESANITNQTGIDGDCNLDYSGSYITISGSPGGTTIDSNAIDGDWDSFGSAGFDAMANSAYYYINYTKPLYATGSIWQSKLSAIFDGNYTSVTYNYSMPSSCWNYSSERLILRLYSDKDTEAYSQCYNGSSWIKVDDTNSHDGQIYEEAMIWIIEEPFIDDISSTLTSKNENWTFSCRGNDGTNDSSWLNSTTLTISNSIPITNSSNILPVTAYTNDTLLGYCEFTDTDEDIQSYEYKWYKNNLLYNEGSSTCYQESANIDNQTGIDDNCNLYYNGSYTLSDSGDNAYMYVDYVIPENTQSAVVKLKAGYLKLEYEVNVTSTCLDDNILQLYYYTTDTSTFGKCYDGSSWVEIFSLVGGAKDGVGSETTHSVWYDGNWNTGATHIYGIWRDSIARGSSNGIFYEESVIWNIANYNQSGLFNINNITNSNFIKGDNLTFSCRSNDGINYSNWLNSTNIKIKNSVPIINTLIIYPSNPEDYNNLTFTNSTIDNDNDNITSYDIKWYKNSIYNLSFDNISIINSTYTSIDDIWVLSMKVYDGEEWSEWTNSTSVQIGDTTNPNISNDVLSASSGTNDAPFTIYVDVTDGSPITKVNVSITDPNEITTVYDMSLYSDNTYSKVYTPSTDGVYTFSFSAIDSFGNNNSLVSSLSYTESTSVPVVGGGGGSSITIVEFDKRECDITFTPEIVYIDDSNNLIEIRLENRENITFTPEVEFRNIDNETSIIDEIRLSNEIGTIMKDSFKSFGVQYKNSVLGTELQGEAEIVLITPTCYDIIIPIKLNIGETTLISDLLNPEISFINKLKIFLSKPLNEKTSWAKLWILILIVSIVLATITFKSKSWSENKTMNIILKIIGLIISIMIVTSIISFLFNFIIG